MRFVDAEEALQRLLERVERGEMITITKHGREVVRLVPVTPTSANPDEIVAALRNERPNLRLSRHSVRRMFEDGRR